MAYKQCRIRLTHDHIVGKVIALLFWRRWLNTDFAIGELKSRQNKTISDTSYPLCSFWYKRCLLLDWSNIKLTLVTYSRHFDVPRPSFTNKSLLNSVIDRKWRISIVQFIRKWRTSIRYSAVTALYRHCIKHYGLSSLNYPLPDVFNDVYNFLSTIEHNIYKSLRQFPLFALNLTVLDPCGYHCGLEVLNHKNQLRFVSVTLSWLYVPITTNGLVFVYSNGRQP